MPRSQSAFLKPENQNRAINSTRVIVGHKVAVTMTPSQWEMGPNELRSHIKEDPSSAVLCVTEARGGSQTQPGSFTRCCSRFSATKPRVFKSLDGVINRNLETCRVPGAREGFLPLSCDCDPKINPSKS